MTTRNSRESFHNSKASLPSSKEYVGIEGSKEGTRENYSFKEFGGKRKSRV